MEHRKNFIIPNSCRPSETQSAKTLESSMKKLALLLSALLLQGCIQTMAIRTMGGIMDYGLEAFNEEGDLKLAEGALGSNLKLVEALIKGDPQNSKLLLMASQGFNAYALAFAEDDSLERARLFYLRGRDYGMRVLLQNQKIREAVDKDIPTFQAALATLTNDDVPAVFWTAFGWGSYINITRSDVGVVADLPKVMAMMEFVRQTDPTFYHGGPYLILGSIEGSMPQVLGGRPEKAKEYFERALSVNGGKFLLTYVYYAKTYAVQTQNQELFESLLKKVDDASPDILPEARLSNAIAKKKARLLREHLNDLF
jgi:tetratricopeptide (TPR) repeat protein